MWEGLKKNWTLKFFSLLVAGLLFFFVSVESGTPVDLDFPIEYRTSNDIMITNQAPDLLNVTLRGPWAAFKPFLGSEMDPVIVELSGGEPGVLRHRVAPEDIRAPAGMSVVTIRPSELEIHLDRRVERQIPVEIDPLGRPAFGFEIVEMRADPPRVAVSGPKTKMQTLDFVYTRPVDIRERSDDLDVEVELRPPAPPMRIVSRKRVKVFVDLSEEQSLRPMELAVKLLNAQRARMTPAKVTVTLKGPRRVVDRLEKSALSAVVDANPEANDGVRRFEKPIRVEGLPDRVVVVGNIPTVEVTLPAKRRRNN